MKKVCVLSSTGVNDSRARRTIVSMSKIAEVDYFFIADQQNDASQSFNENVNLFPIENRSNSSFLNKLLRHSFFYMTTSFFYQEVKIRSEKTYDIVYCHDLIMSYPSYKLAKDFDSKIIYDVHDLYIETINQFFPRKSSVIKSVVYRTVIKIMQFIGVFWQNKFIKKTQLIVTTNENYKKYLSDKYTVKNCIITPNYPEFKKVETSNELYDTLQLDENIHKVVLYHGALTEGRFLHQIVGSAQFFKKNTCLVIVGEGPLRGELEGLGKSLNLENLFFLPFVQYDKLLCFISGATLGLILIEHINLSKKYALANKVTEYMAAGIPILASESPENVRIIKKANCGYTKTFNTSEELGNYINKIVSDNSTLVKLSDNGRYFFENEFNWDKFEPLFFESFKKLLN